MRPDALRLYLVSDASYCAHDALVDQLGALAQAGVSMVQLRDKQASTRELVTLARRMKAELEPHGVPLLINDRADVAFAAGADGVHVGASDLAPEDARRLLGPEAIIGVSVEAPDGPLDENASYYAASPVFATPTKTDTAPPLGFEGVEALVGRTLRPIVGIGGLGPGRLAPLRRAGAAGAAVVSAILAAPDLVAAARALREELDRPQETS